MSVKTTLWALKSLFNGLQVRLQSSVPGAYYYVKEDKIFCSYTGQVQALPISGLWSLHEPEIRSYLPHEYAFGLEILVRDKLDEPWKRSSFKCYCHGTAQPFGTSKDAYRYCLPYYKNEFLEGAITEMYGAVPKGYKPPYYAKLGDKNYFKKGDEVYLFGQGLTSVLKIKEIDSVLFVELCEFKGLYTMKGSSSHRRHSPQELFHSDAIIFDNHGRPMAIQHEYEILRPHTTGE